MCEPKELDSESQSLLEDYDDPYEEAYWYDEDNVPVDPYEKLYI